MSMQFFCEILGTVAFAISGAMSAIEHRMDIFGIVILGIVTALGGGFMRDVILNINPPSLFANPVCPGLAIFTSLCVFFEIKYRIDMDIYISREKFKQILNISDAIGLGMFTAIGVNVNILAGYGHYAAFTVFLGVLTGVGGGVIRDVLAGVTPKILRKQIYACASIVGAICYCLLMDYVSQDLGMLLCALLVTIIRIAAYKYEWDLPTIGYRSRKKKAL